MRTLNGIRRFLGTRGALRYLKDYHQSRVNPEGSWDTESQKVLDYGRGTCAETEEKVVRHASFMHECGSDLENYRER